MLLEVVRVDQLQYSFVNCENWAINSLQFEEIVLLLRSHRAPSPEEFIPDAAVFGHLRSEGCCSPWSPEGVVEVPCLMV